MSDANPLQLPPKSEQTVRAADRHLLLNTAMHAAGLHAVYAVAGFTTCEGQWKPQPEWTDTNVTNDQQLQACRLCSTCAAHHSGLWSRQVEGCR